MNSPEDHFNQGPSIDYRPLFELSNDAILIVSPEGEIRDGNKIIKKYSGYSIDELKYNSILDYIINEDIEKAQNWIDNFKKDLLIEDTFRFIHRNGEVINFLVNSIPVDPSHREKGCFLIFKDMRTYDQMISKYRQSELNFKIIAENVQDVVILMNEQKEYLYVSPSSKEMFGFDNDKIKDNQQNPFFNIHTDDVELLGQSYQTATATGKPFHIIIRAWHEQKGWVWTEMKGTPVYDEKQEFRHMVLVARDITMQKEKQEKLEYFAYHDTLTGLPNRRFFEKRLDKAIDRLNTLDQAFSIILFDIDDFKKINDSWGHSIGDEVIKIVGERTIEAADGTGMAARLGGDEFIVLLPEDRTRADVEQFIGNLRSALSRDIPTEKGTLSITNSIGAAICTKQHQSALYYYNKADHALYHVKEKGKNQYHITHA